MPWDQYLAGYLDAYFKVHPDFAVNAGLHQYDGKLPDFSREALDREIARLHFERDRAAGMRDGLDETQRFECDYLLALIDSDLFWLEKAEWPYRNPYFYGGVDPAVYLTRPYAPLATRMRAFTDYARALPLVLQQIQTNLRTPMPRTYADFGRLTFGGLAKYLNNDVPGIFASVDDAHLQAEFSSANQAAIQALEALDQWFEAQQAIANDNFAIGRDLFQQMLHATEQVDVPLERLRALAQQDLERNQAALLEACARVGPGKTPRECLAEENAEKPEGNPVEAARAQLDSLRTFVDEQDLVSIPGTERALVDESPPYARWNIAYIQIPGPFEKGLPSVYYIAPPDPAWTPEEQKAYLPGKASLLFTSVHEVMPGHFVQFLHANRAKSKLGQLFVGYGYAEGWAHYTEEMMWEAGLGNGDPKIQMGQLAEALLRNVRFLCAIGLHTGEMTVAGAAKMFREVAFSDAGTASQQAARGTFDPAYLNYTMGKLMILKLRDEWTAKRGGRAAWREFHDTLLQYGGPPIPLVRTAMLGPSAGPAL